MEVSKIACVNNAGFATSFGLEIFHMLKTLAVAAVGLAFAGGLAFAQSPSATATPKLPPSTAISHSVAFNLINSTNTIIADLASQNLDGRDHQIRTLSEGRILVSAQVRIDNPRGIAVRGACHLFISDGTGPANGLTEIGVRPAVWFTTDNPAYNLTVPVLGYATKRQGTYNVVVECEQLGINGGTTGQLDNMIVWEASAKAEHDERD